MFRFYANMQIKNQNNPTSFKSKFLNPVYFNRINQNETKTLVKGICSRLEKEDLTTLEKLDELWNVPHALMQDFRRNFDFFNFTSKNNTREFYAIEDISKKPPEKKFKALMELYTANLSKNKFLCLENFFVNPMLFSENKERKFANIGEMFLGKVFSKAKEENADFVRFVSSEHNFYKKVLKRAGIKTTGNNYFNKDADHFCIPKIEFDKYIQYCKKKYNTDFDVRA